MSFRSPLDSCLSCDKLFSEALEILGPILKGLTASGVRMKRLA